MHSIPPHPHHIPSSSSSSSFLSPGEDYPLMLFTNICRAQHNPELWEHLKMSEAWSLFPWNSPCLLEAELWSWKHPESSVATGSSETLPQLLYIQSHLLTLHKTCTRNNIINYSIFFFFLKVLKKIFFLSFKPGEKGWINRLKKPMSLNLYRFSVRSSMEETTNSLILSFRMQSCYIWISQLLRVKVTRHSIT